MHRTLAVFCLLPALAWADSPLTSVDFHKAYAEEPAVQAALERNLERAYSFLAGGSPNDRKLAVANALGWQTESARGFVAFLAQGKDVKPEALTTAMLTPSQLFALAYVVALSNYLELDAVQTGSKGVLGMKPVALMQAAANAQRDDFTVQYVNALVKAQRAMDDEKQWCRVFSLPNDVLRAFPPDKRNLRPAALEEAQGYLQSYEEYCAGSKAAARKNVEELNQVYTLSLLPQAAREPQVIAGTQGGVVVWDAGAPSRPRAIHPGFICRGLVVRGVAWHGCETEVVRWDGTRFQPFLPRTGKNTRGTYYQPMLGPRGELWIRLGAKTWQWDEASAAFSPVKAPWAFDPYDALFFQGQPFTIEFLRAIRVGQSVVPRSSEVYPGSDPRAFRVDAAGALWVEDFESGLFRFEQSRFVAHPGLAQKASGVASDPSRKVRVLLHYTAGLVVQREGQPDETVDLHELENMRDLAYDERTGDVWVAGWGQFVRLRPDGRQWATQRFRVRASGLE